MPLTMR